MCIKVATTDRTRSIYPGLQWSLRLSLPIFFRLLQNQCFEILNWDYYVLLPDKYSHLMTQYQQWKTTVDTYGWAFVLVIIVRRTCVVEFAEPCVSVVSYHEDLATSTISCVCWYGYVMQVHEGVVEKKHLIVSVSFVTFGQQQPTWISQLPCYFIFKAFNVSVFEKKDETP